MVERKIRSPKKPPAQVAPAPTGIFLVDLQGLKLSGVQLAKIEAAIQEVVQLELAKLDDTEGAGGGPLGGVMGYRVAT